MTQYNTSTPNIISRDFQSSFLKFPLLIKRLDGIDLVTHRVEQHVVASGLLVAAGPRGLAADKGAFAKRKFYNA